MTRDRDFSELESAPDQGAEHAQYYRRVLHELIDMGADLARLVHQRAVASDAEAGVGVVVDATVAYDRVCRGVRRSIMLARRLDEPVARERPERQRVVARAHIIRAVEDAIQRGADEYEVESLEGELHERLDAPDLEDDLGSRPVAEIITDICRDLGLGAPDGTWLWKRRTPADVAALVARAAMPRGDVSFVSVEPRWGEPPGGLTETGSVLLSRGTLFSGP